MLVTAIGDEILSPTSLPQNNHSQKIYIGRIAICLTFIFSLRDIFPNFGRVQRGGERIETFFFTMDVAPRRVSNHGPLYGNYSNSPWMISHKSKFFIILVFLSEKVLIGWIFVHLLSECTLMMIRLNSESLNQLLFFDKLKSVT